MADILRGFPDLPVQTQRVSLGETEFSVRLRWRRRLNQWTIDLYTADGTPLLVGRRVTPGAAAYIADRYRLADGPDGALLASGRDPYVQADLGTVLELTFFTSAELAEILAAAETPSTVRVTP